MTKAPKTKNKAAAAQKTAAPKKASAQKAARAQKAAQAMKAPQAMKTARAQKAAQAQKAKTTGVGGAKKPAAKPNGAPTPQAEDPRFVALLAAFAADPELAPVAAAFAAARTLARGRRFGDNGLKADGKLFALFVRGQLVVKLPAARVAALLASGDGEPFTAGGRRTMKEWLALAAHNRAWEALAREAYTFVQGANARRPSSATR